MSQPPRPKKNPKHMTVEELAQHNAELAAWLEREAKRKAREEEASQRKLDRDARRAARRERRK